MCVPHKQSCIRRPLTESGATSSISVQDEQIHKPCGCRVHVIKKEHEINHHLREIVPKNVASIAVDSEIMVQWRFGGGGKKHEIYSAIGGSLFLEP